jgi:hypothetical protein
MKRNTYDGLQRASDPSRQAGTQQVPGAGGAATPSTHVPPLGPVPHLVAPTIAASVTAPTLGRELAWTPSRPASRARRVRYPKDACRPPSKHRLQRRSQVGTGDRWERPRGRGSTPSPGRISCYQVRSSDAWELERVAVVLGTEARPGTRTGRWSMVRGPRRCSVAVLCRGRSLPKRTNLAFSRFHAI